MRTTIQLPLLALSFALSLTLAYASEESKSESESPSYYPQRYYQVADLTDDDYLNVRAAPNSNAEDIGDISEGSQPWEVLEIDSTGKWGKIVWHEGNGWIALDYLQPVVVNTVNDSFVPVGLICTSPDPHWILELETSKTIRLSTDHSSTELPITDITEAAGKVKDSAVLSAYTPALDTRAVVRKAHCEISKRSSHYGWSADLLILTSNQLLSGCCFLRYPE